jgi:hypothetical protein
MFEILLPVRLEMAQVPAVTKKTQIVIVGGGAGGLELVRKLGARYRRKHFDIILVEKTRTHVWKPLLHEVAAGALDANLDEVGYRSHCHRWGYRFFFGALEGIDREARQVIIAPILDEGGEEIIGRQTIRYDYLVLAVGAVTNHFGTPGAKEHCLLLDDRDQADRFRLKLLNHCLRVSRQMSADPASDAHVRVSIVGGGATGVELAAELFNAASALKHVFEHGFRPNAPSPSDLLFSLFLHANLAHLLGNMLFLFIYGDNVEHRLGRLRFLGAYLCAGMFATLFHWFFDIGSGLPLIGASGATSRGASTGVVSTARPSSGWTGFFFGQP